jgi:hypothetical protein
MRRIGLLAAIVWAQGCASAPHAPHDEIAARFVHRIAFETGQEESTATDRVQVLELWGTRPRIEIGGEYLVVGRYTLQSEERGRVYFWLTANNWRNEGPNMDLQWAPVSRGTGRFVLQHKMHGPGWFHVNLCGEETELADLYFGTGDTVLRGETTVGTR